MLLKEELEKIEMERYMNKGKAAQEWR